MHPRFPWHRPVSYTHLLHINGLEVGLGEIAVILGILLGTQQDILPGNIVPAAGLLVDLSPVFQYFDLPGRLICDRPDGGGKAVDMLHLHSGAEFGAALGAYRNIAVSYTHLKPNGSSRRAVPHGIGNDIHHDLPQIQRIALQRLLFAAYLRLSLIHI